MIVLISIIGGYLATYQKMLPTLPVAIFLKIKTLILYDEIKYFLRLFSRCYGLVLRQ